MALIRRGVLPAVLVAALAACAGRPQSDARRPSPSPTPDAFASLEARSTRSPEPKAAPRWEQIGAWTGAGPATKSFAISKDAIQWRADWSCGAGNLRLETAPKPRDGKPVAESGCPGSGQAYSARTGSVRLTIHNEGEWRIVVSQQVTSPVDEPPMPAMTAPGARLLSRGDFFAIERKGKGQALLYRLADRRLALRLEGFETSANTDLYVWTSEAERPATSKEALDSPHEVIAELKSTLGNQNYLLPGELSPGKIRSIVIWCQPVQIAYVASALGPVA